MFKRLVLLLTSSAVVLVVVLKFALNFNTSTALVSQSHYYTKRANAHADTDGERKLTSTAARLRM